MNNYEKIELDEIIIHKEDECPICYEYLKNYIILECDHKYCLKCLNGQLEHNLFKCPLCRIEIDDIKNCMKIHERLKERNNNLLKVNTYLVLQNKILNHKYQKLVIKFLCFLFILFLYIYTDLDNRFDISNKKT